MIRTLIEFKSPRGNRILGPEDHGRAMTLEMWERAREKEGYVYEIIDGALIVSPNPTPLHDYWVQTIAAHLRRYAARNPKVINWISERCDVVVPGRAGETRPQPDLAAYQDFPSPPPARWEDVQPRIVVEVISPRRGHKDVTRNRHLYWLVRSIVEYWIVDPTKDSSAPTLVALARRPRQGYWIEEIVPYGSTYRCKTLPRLSLNLKRGRKSKG